MYAVLLFLHSVCRWLVLISLIYAIIRAFRGYSQRRPFTKTDATARQMAVNFAQLQFTIGMVLYFVSPVSRYFLMHFKAAITDTGTLFFGCIHALLMIAAVGVISTGAGVSQRSTDDHTRFSKMLLWYAIALLIILIAVPWPFSPFAHRPYLRTF
ncbi:hypothetical protein [Chitinophaga vietnamensis]|uniref:hypothetical protein n=1 Tax=Chitinophaga vietnamensis TaxID=2593957 RepID=UPI001178CC80|nr:hypothetical protein [Chitinophaga vietnamensis]